MAVIMGLGHYFAYFWGLGIEPSTDTPEVTARQVPLPSTVLSGLLAGRVWDMFFRGLSVED